MLASSKIERNIKGLVSIIIPAYQAEAFIDRSARSALEQTYKDVEVIVVENGSTDKTIEIVQKISDRRLTILQSEKGVSNARNMGIDNCKGEFLFFLDADDWLEKDAIECMISLADEDVDLVSARYFGDKPFEDYYYYRYENDSEEYIVKCLCTPTKRGNCTGNLYRTEFIRKHGLRFSPELSHAEDSVFFTQLLVKQPVVIDMEKPVYHVFKNPASATRKAKHDNSPEFRKAIIELYKTVSECSDRIINSGYIFALNQLLVILVNSNKGFFELLKYVKSTLKQDVFAEAVQMADISEVDGAMKIVFTLMKNNMHLALTIVVEGRSYMNLRRREK